MSYIEAIGIRLEGLLRDYGWSQKEFAIRTGVSRMTINGTVRGRVKIVTFEKLLIFCDALGITLHDFFNHEIFAWKLSLVHKTCEGGAQC